MTLGKRTSTTAVILSLFSPLFSSFTSLPPSLFIFYFLLSSPFPNVLASSSPFAAPVSALSSRSTFHLVISLSPTFLFPFTFRALHLFELRFQSQQPAANVHARHEDRDVVI